MSANLLRPQAIMSPPEALDASRQAPNILRRFAPWNVPYPLSLLLNSDAVEKWTIYENLFYTCLRTGDNRSASLCLDRLRERFGVSNERVMAMTGLYHEAIVENEQELESYLTEYEEAVFIKPINMVMRKRKVALLKSMSRISEATATLVELLDMSPIDAEAWAELAELYLLQNMYAQAVYSMEEVLLITPNAWNMHARLAEILYISAMSTSSNDQSRLRLLVRALKTFCRSIELCDNYLRGFYGLKLTTNQLQNPPSKPATFNAPSSTKDSSADEDFPVPSLSTVQKLNELATSQLGEIIRKYSTHEPGWDGYDEAEIIAARELLDRGSKGIAR